MRLMSTPIALQPAWSWARTDWHDKLSTWLQAELPKILTILVVAFVLARLLGVFTRKLQELSRRNELPSRIRAQQLRTLASVIQSVGIVVIYFFALLQILDTFQINIAPLLASAGIVGLAIGFGAQTLVHDVINGFFILLENIYDI